ncbi:extender of chronological lifespan protein Ecl1 [Schizosaccharomyces pombe]|uniref:Extender of the chronological lifespan protein 1 n=1 Tax=Schizosaccharomyces pombe (strain 972 / ATCC 24843) TaxID=284812 RepID=ECL1_SCHPO|nr:protein Ecl1 [Schizosaccharomyces pombe]C6Y4D3.1 RecName: Full=Extender of the chronological lifespan protein 1 [Schizosaccharomyces pombe 972h-]CBA11520.1 extender of the chronological lifespan protein Ecl1 [Schizosaccharomyces pombe]|eukprot:NP_001343095.1 protein Ecl1 [Schizosaccharomyces pombe]
MDLDFCTVCGATTQDGSLYCSSECHLLDFTKLDTQTTSNISVSSEYQFLVSEHLAHFHRKSMTSADFPTPRFSAYTKLHA